MTELKPCPFCGGEVEYGITWRSIRYIQCKNCNIKISGFNNKKDLVNAWNARQNLWNTGTPTEEGWYVCRMKDYPMFEYDTDYFEGSSWRYYSAEYIVKWQKIKEN